MTLLAQRDQARLQARELLFQEVRARLRTVLHEVAPGTEFVLFGSLARSEEFREGSDIDLAFTTLPAGKTEYRLTAEIEERMGRPVDLIDLNRSRLAAKIIREGEKWTP